ncbi:MAG: ABC transporter permease [Opitutales bacterium]|nr:ABC transporter permease [Opitutales bacterium]
MPWWLYIALKQLFPSGKIMSFFAAVSILGVALGILGLFGTQSVMNGFHAQIGEKLRDTTGDIIIRNYGQPMYNQDAICKHLRQMPEVLRVETVANGPVMMLSRNVPIFPMLRSYDTIKDESALPIKEKHFIKMGKIENLDDDSIVLGQRLAAINGISVGDSVEIFSPTMLDKINKDEVPLPAKLEVVGLLSTDYSEVDSNVALVSLRRMKDLYGLGNGVHSIVVALKSGVDCKSFAEKLRNSQDIPYRVSTWLTANEGFLRVIKMEKVMMSLIIFLIIIVASFSICISLYTSVLRKTREIGLSGAMGARPYQIALTYCFQGLLIGVLGSCCGIALTMLVLYFREPLVEIIVGREALIEFYHFAHLPVKYELNDAITACVFATVLCTIAGVFPAVRAARLKISEAMRND